MHCKWQHNTVYKKVVDSKSKQYAVLFLTVNFLGAVKREISRIFLGILDGDAFKHLDKLALSL